MSRVRRKWVGGQCSDLFAMPQSALALGVAAPGVNRPLFGDGHHMGTTAADFANLQDRHGECVRDSMRRQAKKRSERGMGWWRGLPQHEGERRLDVQDALYKTRDRHHSPRGRRHRHRIAFPAHVDPPGLDWRRSGKQVRKSTLRSTLKSIFFVNGAGCVLLEWGHLCEHEGEPSSTGDVLDQHLSVSVASALAGAAPRQEVIRGRGMTQLSVTAETPAKSRRNTPAIHSANLGVPRQSFVNTAVLTRGGLSSSSSSSLSSAPSGQNASGVSVSDSALRPSTKNPFISVF